MTKTKQQTLNRIPFWLYIAAGVVLGLVVTAAFYRKAYCFYVYQPGGTALIAVMGGGSALAAYAAKTLLAKVDGRYRRLVYAGAAAVITLVLVVFLSPLVRPLEKNQCVDRYDQILALIDQEGLAVRTKDMAIIRDIYTKDALVKAASTGETWPADSYYRKKFTEEEHCTNSHGSYQVVSFNSSEVILTTSSQGTWGPAGQGCIYSYSGPDGSDQWTFARVSGQWKIANFEFNRLSE